MRFCKLSFLFSKQFFVCLCGYLFGITVILLNNSLLFNYNTNYNNECQNFLPLFTSENAEMPTTKQSNLLMVGIMTAENFVNNRAWTVWQTWAQNIPGKLWFFVAESTKSAHEDELPLIRLKGVDDVYPPQKKSFAMIRWMYDNYVSCS